MAHGEVPESWQRLLDQAGGDGTHMRLAHAAPMADSGSGGGDGKGGPGGGEPDLKNEKSPWDTAASSLESLKDNLNTALRELRTGQKGTGKKSDGVDGLASAAMQTRVFNSWEARLELTRDECAEVSDKLDKANSTMVKGEQDIVSMFGKHEAKPKKPHGGPHEGQW